MREQDERLRGFEAASAASIARLEAHAHVQASMLQALLDEQHIELPAAAAKALQLAVLDSAAAATATPRQRRGSVGEGGAKGGAQAAGSHQPRSQHRGSFAHSSGNPQCSGGGGDAGGDAHPQRDRPSGAGLAVAEAARATRTALARHNSERMEQKMEALEHRKSFGKKSAPGRTCRRNSGSEARGKSPTSVGSKSAPGNSSDITGSGTAAAGTTLQQSC